MANNSGQPQQQQMLYYAYTALPSGAQGQQFGGQDGMNPGQCDGSQQVMMFQNPETRFGYGDDTANNIPGGVTMPMGHMPQPMVPAGQGGNMVPGQMMLLTTMMGGQQQQPQMDQNQDSGQANTAWAPNMQQPGGQDQTPMQSAGMRNRETLGSKAFMIVDPKTGKEVTKGDGGQTPGGQQGGGQGNGPPPSWPQQQPTSQQPFNNGPPPSSQDGQIQGMQQQQQTSQDHQQSPVIPQSQGPAAQQNQTASQQSPQLPESQPGGNQAPSATSKRKLLVNKKLPTKQKGAEANLAEAPASSVRESTAEKTDAPGSVAPSPSPSPEAAQRKPGVSGGRGNEGGGSGGGSGGAGGGLTGGASTQLSRWPPPPSGGPSSNFASSIKALNLEPMRAQPNRAKAAGLGRVAPQPLGSLQSGQQISSNQQTAQEQPSQATSQPQQSAQQSTQQTSQPEQSQPQHQPSPQLPQNQGPQQSSPMIPQNQGPQQQQSQPQMQQSPNIPSNQGPQQPPAQQSPMMPPNQGPQNQQQPVGMQQSPMMPQNQGPQPNQPQASPMMPSNQGPQQQPPMQQYPMQGIHMMQQGMPHMMMPMPMMPQPMAQPQPQPVQPQSAPPAPMKPKGVKLKNAVLARKSKPNEDGEEPSKEGGQQQSPAVPGRSPAEEQMQELAKAKAPISLKPPDQIFQRTLMLRIWQVCKDMKHAQVQGLTTSARLADKNGTPGPSGRKPRPPIQEEVRRPKKPEQDKMMHRGENAWCVKKATDREEEIERKVRMLLNKICPTNLKTIVQQLAQVDLKSAQELDFVIRIIFEKALAEPHWCETYADMVYSLQTKYPKFPAENEGDKAQTFTRVLLNTCQTEFENLPTSFEPTAEQIATMDAEDLGKLREKDRKEKEKAKANMKFIGNLFLRQLLAVKVIGQVVYELIGIKDSPPEEHKIECVCELLTAIGHCLDEQEHGKKLMLQFTARLMELKMSTGADGKAAFSKRVQFQIQDLLDLRKNGWQKKMLKETAKKLTDIRNDMNTEAKLKGKGKGQDAMFVTQLAGAKPAFMEDVTSKAKQQQAQRKADWDNSYVKRMLSYYAEDKDVGQLESMWMKGQPNESEVKMAVERFVEHGFSVDANHKANADVVADIMSELLRLRCLSWNVLDDTFGPHLEQLEEIKLDAPYCDLFVHALFAKFFQTFGRDVSPKLLNRLPREGNIFYWKLLCGALRKLKERQSAEGVRRAIESVPQLQDTLCNLGSCKRGDVMKRLQEEGCL